MTRSLSRAETAATLGKYRRIRGPDPGWPAELSLALSAAAVSPGSGGELPLGLAILSAAAIGLRSLGIDPSDPSSDPEARLLRAALPADLLLEGRRALAWLRRAASRRPLDYLRLCGPERQLWQFGHDGHDLTREGAQRLRVLRRFEPLSAVFRERLERAFYALAPGPEAILCWRRGRPWLLADADRAGHRRCLTACASAEPEGLLVFARGAAAGWATPRSCPLVADPAGVMAAFVGPAESAELVERRLGGLTISFAVPGAAPRALADRALPPHWRALARSASEPRS